MRIFARACSIWKEVKLIDATIFNNWIRGKSFVILFSLEVVFECEATFRVVRIMYTDMFDLLNHVIIDLCQDFFLPQHQRSL